MWVSSSLSTLSAKFCNTVVTPFTKSLVGAGLRRVKPCGAERSRGVSFGNSQNSVTCTLCQRSQQGQRFFPFGKLRVRMTW